MKVYLNIYHYQNTESGMYLLNSPGYIRNDSGLGRKKKTNSWRLVTNLYCTLHIY